MDQLQSSAPPIRPEELEATLERSIGIPLSALRASLESLNDRLPGEEPLGGVIEEVLRIGSNVRELMEFICPPQPHAVPCGASEVVFNALRGLPEEKRQRVTLARIESNGRLHTDPEILARGLRRVVENALEATSGFVLINVKSEAGAVVFTTVNRHAGAAGDGVDWEWAQSPFHTDKPDHLGLGLTIAHRDVELLGGTLELSCTPLGETIAVARIPLDGGAA